MCIIHIGEVSSYALETSTQKSRQTGNNEDQVIDLRVERFIEPCLLLLLVEKPAHGYELIERLNEVWLGPEKQDPGQSTAISDDLSVEEWLNPNGIHQEEVLQNDYTK